MAYETLNAEADPADVTVERPLSPAEQTLVCQFVQLTANPLLTRSLGQQKVTVEHVTVNDGGQAIVGAVAQGGEGWQQKVTPTPCTRLTAPPDAQQRPK